MLKQRLVLGVLAVATISVMWFFRPFLHEPLMEVYVHPVRFMLWAVALAWLLVFGFRVRRHLESVKPQTLASATDTTGPLPARRSVLPPLAIILFLAFFLTAVFGIVGFVFASVVLIFIGRKFRLVRMTDVVWLLVFVVLLGAVSFESLWTKYTTAQTVTFSARNDFPVVRPVRVQPKIVSERYAKDSLQNPQEYLGDSAVVLIDGVQKRVYPRLPDGGLLYFTNKLSGFVAVDVSALEKDLSIENQTFTYAEHTGVLDNLQFVLLKHKYFVSYENPVYLKDPVTGRWATVVSYTRYVGFPVRVPVWGGFFVVESDGTITDHAPADSERLALTKGNRVYPDTLARYYAESYALKGGIVNYLFYHKDQPVIDELEPGTQPFHLATTEGYKQVIVAKPYGSSNGIYKIFIFDATTGKRDIIEFAQDSLLTGPVASLSYIQKAFPAIDYSTFSIVEPRPVMSGKDFYWLSSVVNADGAGIAKTVALNANTNEAMELVTKEDIVKFVEGSQAPNIATSTSDSPVSVSKMILEKLQRIHSELREIEGMIKDPKDPH